MIDLPQKELSFWKKDHLEAAYPQLQSENKVDAVIVGAGITGLTAAYLLKKSGLTVAVVEKDTVGGGTTGRTTGKVSSQHGLIYDELARKHGVKKARAYGRANEAAITMVDNIVRHERINCGWVLDDNFVYTADPEKIRQFKRESIVAARLGLPATFEKDLPLPFSVSAAVRFSGQGKIHAQKYISGLAAAVDGAGSFVYEKSTVTGIRDGAPGRVRTKEGMLTAKYIIVATNVPTLPLIARGGYCVMEYPTESYIVAGRPEVELKGMYISPDRKHFSIFPFESDDGKVLLIGGGGHISGMRLSKDRHFERLAEYGRNHFGMDVAYKWSDRDYIAYDGIPLVGRVYPWSKNLYLATAFRKWGLSNGTVAAMLLHDEILGIDNPWVATFNSIRAKPIASIPGVALKYFLGKA